MKNLLITSVFIMCFNTLYSQSVYNAIDTSNIEFARARGKKGGRPKGLSPENLQLALTALDLHDTGKYAISEIATRLKMPIATCYRNLS